MQQRFRVVSTTLQHSPQARLTEVRFVEPSAPPHNSRPNNCVTIHPTLMSLANELANRL